jgi:transcriptional antiterminator NusG
VVDHDENKNEIVGSSEPQTAEAATENKSPLSEVREGLAWYVVHVFSGFENKVKIALQERIKSLKQEKFFGEVVVPEENVVELVKGQKKTTKRKFFPGYIIVQMVLNDDTWHLVKHTPKVTGFVGDKKNPAPIPTHEVERMA